MSDALSTTNALSSDLLLEDNTTYYAVNNDGQCNSQPFAITIFFALSVANNDIKFLKYYPNPVESILNVVHDKPIDKLEIYNSLGQLVLNKHYQNPYISVDLSELQNSLYIVKIKSDDQLGVLRIIKK